MGCGSSNSAAISGSDNTETPVEAFNPSTEPDTPKAADVSSRQTREETIAANKQRNDVRVTESAYTPSGSPAKGNPVGATGAFGPSPVLTREQALPNPFARQEQIGMSPPTEMQGSGAGGYIKAKDTKKRGGFDPEKFRQANGRGGLVESAAPAASTGMQPQAMEFSANSFNSGGAKQRTSSFGNSGGGAAQMGGPMGGHSMGGQGQMGGPMGMGGGPSGPGMDAPMQQQQPWQQQQQPNPYIGASLHSPQVVEFQDSSSQHRKASYGALSWEDPGSAQRGAVPGPDDTLNRTDEQELDDILEEMGDI